MMWLLWACTSQAPSDSLTVLAASSLTDAVTELGRAFEQGHPPAQVTPSFAGSHTLATQIRHGLQADVLASADEAHLASLHADQLVQPPRAFAGNTLVLALSDRIDPAVTLRTLTTVDTLVLGDPVAPVGRYTEVLLDAAQRRYGASWREQLEQRVASREPNARLVIAKVALGEADAAIAYATDATAVQHVNVVPLPELSPTAGYFHAELTTSTQPALARAWTAFVESEEGQQILRQHGFTAASP
ncbi:MAG: molybdate ABC transporter substrate-binding protein [Myxococcales bacterium]|nr:molybdate ABC transporter substrate-binding protein [Myxococcales bacterium]